MFASVCSRILGRKCAKANIVVGFFCVALIRLTCYCHSRLVPSLLLSFVAVVGRSRVTSTAFRRRERRPTGRKERKRARESSPLAPSHHPLRVSLSRTDSRSFSLPSLPTASFSPILPAPTPVDACYVS